MGFKVRLFLGDELIDPSDYDKVIIKCTDVDKFVNEVYERNERRPLTLEAPNIDCDPQEPLPVKRKGSVLEMLKKNQSIVKEQPRSSPKKEKGRDSDR